MLLILIVGLTAVVAVAGLGFIFLGAAPSQTKALKRANVIGGQSKAEKTRRSNQDTVVNRRKQILSNLKTVERRQRKQSLTLEARLRQAGLNSSGASFWIASAVMAVAVFLAAVVLTHKPAIALGLAFAAGLGLPRWVLGFLAKRRVKKFTEEFPNATDIIVRGIKSGLPVNDCLKIIARESPAPLNGEFGRVVENMGLGLTTDQAMEKLYERMPTAEVRFFSIVLAIQQKTGGNLAEALNNLSTVLRARKLMREKIKALSGEAVASAWIIGALPPGVMILVWVMTPGYMTPMFVDPRGHLMLLGGAVWMAMGVFVMRRMINFKF